MTVALITGGLGFIGSYIAKNLLDNNVVDKVVCLDHFASYVDVTNSDYQDYRHKRFIGYEEKIIIERGDAKFYGVTQNVIDKYRPKMIFHLASLPLAKIDNLNVKLIDASKFFFKKLKNITNPEKKRKIIGSLFIKIFEKESKKYKNIKFLAQGTLYPDIIESRSSTGSKSFQETV